MDKPFIQVISSKEAEGKLKGIYDDISSKRGKLADVHQIQSLNPESIVNHMDLYMTLMFGQSPLKRYQREMMAVVVSSVNKCPYCVAHHSEALNHYWKDEQRIRMLIADFETVGLDECDRSLCEYALDLTTEPDQIYEYLHIEQLRACGLNDRAILDAAMIISYFNFVNRLVLGLGVKLEKDKGKGYLHDYVEEIL